MSSTEQRTQILSVRFQERFHTDHRQPGHLPLFNTSDPPAASKETNFRDRREGQTDNHEGIGYGRVILSFVGLRSATLFRSLLASYDIWKNQIILAVRPVSAPHCPKKSPLAPFLS